MARGWESKAVEDQIAEAEARAKAPAARTLTPDEQDRETRRATLQLARASALQDLQRTCDRRHRALLEQTVAHLDEELRKLESPANS
jgi:hypothetical protein